MRALAPALAIIACMVGGSAVAQPEPGNQMALAALLSAGSFEMAADPCRKTDRAGKPKRLADDLAMYLAYFNSGENRARSACKADACEVEFNHERGEAVFSAIYRFRLAGGQIVPGSLECIWVP